MITAPTVANLSILAIIAIAVALNRDGVTQASGALLLALAVVNAGGYLAGYFGGAAFRLPEPMRRALTLEVGMQNAGAGIALAKQSVWQKNRRRSFPAFCTRLAVC